MVCNLYCYFSGVSISNVLINLTAQHARYVATRTHVWLLDRYLYGTTHTLQVGTYTKTKHQNDINVEIFR